MAPHGGMGGPEITGRDRVTHGPVFVERLTPGAGILEIVGKVLEIGVYALVEQAPDEMDEYLVLQNRSNRDMKLPIERNEFLVRPAAPIHSGEHSVEFLDMFRLRSNRRFGRNGSFDDLPRPQCLEGSFGRVPLIEPSGGPAGRADNGDAGPDIDTDEAFDLERNQCFPDARPGHAEAFRELTLRRQPASNRKFASIDQVAQLIGDLPIEPARPNRLQRHSPLL